MLHIKNSPLEKPCSNTLLMSKWNQAFLKTNKIPSHNKARQTKIHLQITLTLTEYTLVLIQARS